MKGMDITMRIMAVDYGDARTGIAVSDFSGTLASGVETIFEKRPFVVAERVAQFAKQLEAEEIVVGMPKNMDNTIGERGEKTDAFIKQLQELTVLTITRWDERLTTVSAIRTLNETNVRGERRKNVIDTVAAEIILQSYLEYRRNKRQS